MFTFKQDNNVPESLFLTPSSLFRAPPDPNEEKPENGLGLLSVFFSSAAAGFSVGVASGAGLLENEKPAKGLGLVSVFFSFGFSVGFTAGAGLLKDKLPKAGLVSAPNLGVPKIEPGITAVVGVTPAAVDAVTLVVVSDWPFV